MLRTSTGACAAHMALCAAVYPVERGDVTWSAWEWTGVNQSLTSALASPQDPSLDPKTILELPLETLAQKLRDEELSLESVLCSYLEEVGVWVGSGVGAITCCCPTQRRWASGVTSWCCSWLGKECVPQSPVISILL